MKKWIFCVAFGAMMFNACATNDSMANNNEILNECRNDNDKIQGCIEKKYYDDGKLRAKITYKDGRNDGLEVWYYTNGNKQSEYVYENGERMIIKFYYKNGNLQEEIIHTNNKQDTVARLYYKNGNLMSETPYKNGIVNGVFKVFYENGNPKIEIPMTDNMTNGTVKQYYENGELAFITIAENNKALYSKCPNGKAIPDDMASSDDLSEISKICKE